MPSPDDLRFRPAEAGDAAAVAALHADSWRRHYRGAFADAFLDGDVAGFLRARWTGLLSAPDPQARTIVAELDGGLVGLAHTRLGDDPAWGALLDNLHVSYGLKRMGVGTRLLALTAQAVLDSSLNPASTCGCSSRTPAPAPSTRPAAVPAWRPAVSRRRGATRPG